MAPDDSVHPRRLRTYEWFVESNDGVVGRRTWHTLTLETDAVVFPSERRLRRRPTREVAFQLGLVLALAAAAVLTVVVIWIAPPHLVTYDLAATSTQGTLEPTDALEAINSRRTALLQGLGGIVLFIGLGATFWQAKITREGHITTTMGSAMENLAHASATVVAGAAYTLQGVARLSPPNRWSITQTLSTHIRQRSPWDTGAAASHDEWLRTRAPEVQAALDAVVRMPRPEGTKWRLNLNGTDLGKAYFENANLRYASLRNSNLTGSYFRDADLRWATCKGAIFTEADLRGADLRYMRAAEHATWQGAVFSDATKMDDEMERLLRSAEAEKLDDDAVREE